MGPWRDDRPHSFNTVQRGEDDTLRRTHRLAALRRSQLPQPPQTCVRTLSSRPYTQSVGQLTAECPYCQVSLAVQGTSAHDAMQPERRKQKIVVPGGIEPPLPT